MEENLNTENTLISTNSLPDTETMIERIYSQPFRESNFESHLSDLISRLYNLLLSTTSERENTVINDAIDLLESIQ